MVSLDGLHGATFRQDETPMAILPKGRGIPLVEVATLENRAVKAKNPI
jgi:hypothetical protein